MLRSLLAAVPLMALVACGPASRNPGNGSGGPDGGSNSADSGPCVPQAEICNDGIDNDCDGMTDCADVDCSGVGTCPVCGMVNAPEATPIPLPDGVSSGTSCSTDAQCSGTTPNCIVAPNTDVGVLKECHASYTSTLDFIGFPMNATLTDPSKLLSVCVDMEHSYLHDLQMEILSPPDANGQRYKVTLHEFVGRVGPEIFLGEPNEDDESGPVIPGVSYHYCFEPSGTATLYGAPMATFNNASGSHMQVPAGNYKPMNPFAGLAGSPLNGTWTFRVTDMFAIDNGTLKGWSIAWDPSLLSSCSGPIIN